MPIGKHNSVTPQPTYIPRGALHGGTNADQVIPIELNSFVNTTLLRRGRMSLKVVREHQKHYSPSLDSHTLDTYAKIGFGNLIKPRFSSIPEAPPSPELPFHDCLPPSPPPRPVKLPPLKPPRPLSWDTSPPVLSPSIPDTPSPTGTTPLPISFKPQRLSPQLLAQFVNNARGSSSEYRVSIREALEVCNQSEFHQMIPYLNADVKRRINLPDDRIQKMHILQAIFPQGYVEHPDYI